MKILLLEPSDEEPDSTGKIKKIRVLLKQLGHQVMECKFNPALYETAVVGKPDVVFNLAGAYEWEKTNLIPAILEIVGVRYTGSGMLALSLVRNPTKLLSLLHKSGIPVVPFKIIKAGDDLGNNNLKFPLVLRRDGSQDQQVLADLKAVKGALEKLPGQEELVLQEHNNSGTASLFILDANSFPISQNTPELELALRAYQLIEARGLVRFDFIDSDQPLLAGIEVSPDPLDEILLKDAKKAGLNEEKVMQALLEHAGRDQ
jgi:D-alanine-D-alanine ligase-like ATP-grasp enzyme